MADDPNTLIRVYLRRLDQRLERMETVLSEHGRLLTRIERRLDIAD
jgi:hypothetical protein